MKTSRILPCFGSKSGFSLVELLVVVGIIMLVAASSLLILDQTDDQARFEKTRQSYKELETALFGPDMLTKLNGNLVTSGFLADSGMMPQDLNDLLRVPPNRSHAERADWNWRPVVPVERGGRIHHGWRGPYVSQTETGLFDHWGAPWRYEPADKSLPEAGRYRFGFRQPFVEPPTLALGSTGKNGLPDIDPTHPPTDAYDKDFPESGFTISPNLFALRSVPVPARTVAKQGGDPTASFTYVVGVVHAGLNMTEPFLNHPSLLRDAAGNLVTITVRPGGGTSTTTTTTTTSSGDDDDDDDDGGTTTTTTTARNAKLPSGLTYNLGYARQIQIALYDPNQGGNTPATNRLLAKLYAADPEVITYHPKTSTSATEALVRSAEAGVWLIP